MPFYIMEGQFDNTLITFTGNGSNDHVTIFTLCSQLSLLRRIPPGRKLVSLIASVKRLQFILPVI